MKNIAFLYGAGILALLSIFVFRYYFRPASKQIVGLAPVAADCSKKTGIDKVICLADAFKASLKDDQLSLVQLQYSKGDAAKWSNFPASFFRNAARVGLNFGSMTATQIEAAKALLREVSGTAANWWNRNTTGYRPLKHY